MNSQQLNLFCDFYKIPFPIFKTELFNNKFTCKIFTVNGVSILQSNFFENENDSIIESINLFYDFCSYENNFIYLVNNSRNLMTIDS